MVGITTYGRPDACSQLLRNLYASLKNAERLGQTFVVVVRDASSHDYQPTLETLQELFPNRFAFYESSSWKGKAGRFQTYQILFDVMQVLHAQRAILLEDDIAFDPTFVSSALSKYEAIPDPHKVALYLAKFDDDELNGRWIRFQRQVHPTCAVDRTQWLDLHGFVAGRAFFERMNWQLFAPHPWRWAEGGQRSSGVSEQMTLRLWRRGNIYQVRETLVYHGQLPSLLNEEARRARALNNFRNDGE